MQLQLALHMHACSCGARRSRSIAISSAPARRTGPGPRNDRSGSETVTRAARARAASRSRWASDRDARPHSRSLPLVEHAQHSSCTVDRDAIVRVPKRTQSRSPSQISHARRSSCRDSQRHSSSRLKTPPLSPREASLSHWRALLAPLRPHAPAARASLARTIAGVAGDARGARRVCELAGGCQGAQIEAELPGVVHRVQRKIRIVDVAIEHTKRQERKEKGGRGAGRGSGGKVSLLRPTHSTAGGSGQGLPAYLEKPSTGPASG